MKIWIKNIAIVSLLSAVAYLTGCATASRPEDMIVQDFKASNPVAETVSVVVNGGRETSSMGASQIADADFATAITQSILESGVFAKVIESENGEYMLSASIISMNQPMFGLSFTVKMETAWRLADRLSGKVVWEKVINSEHTATTGDAFVGTTRLRLANEGAAKNNIRNAIIEIGELKL